ncbi:MAG: hypothetical protein HQM02_05925, partial [Magnetococcales bacterium]|nr:hypothetical protein [Magnetococcales bacterium]
KTEAVKTEPVKKEAVKTEAVKTEPVKKEAVKTEAVKTEPVKTEAVKTEAVKTDSAQESSSVKLPLEKPSATSTLVVKPEPADAQVRIRNIRKAYRPGMSLQAGRYLIEVSRPGYKTASRWMQLPGGGDFEITAPLEEDQVVR